jgi:lysophospholipase L1-like esterase
MKKLIAVFVLLFFTMAHAAAYHVSATGSDDHPGIAEQPFRTILAAGRMTAPRKWLFLGDSITQAGHYVDYIETWFLLNAEDAPAIIDLGLSSETVSGNSEPDHGFARPWVHNRLADVLDRVGPDLVVACYGMNDGIYHPFSEERFSAYQGGTRRLIDAAKSVGADLILLTPPPYAGRVKPKLAPAPGKAYSFRTPFPAYNDVLQRYADWILSLDAEPGVKAIDIRPALEAHLAASYPIEPVHPAVFGHKVMAEAFLQGLGLDTGSDLLETGVNPRIDNPDWVAVLDLVRQQRETYDRALLNDIGHGNPNVMRRFKITLPEARERVLPINAAIEKQLRHAVKEPHD